MKLLFKNKRSEEYCNELSSHFPDTFSRYNTIPNILVKDCLALKDEIENFKSLFPTLPKNRLIQYKTKGFSVLTELIEQKNHSITKQLFLIRIKETADRVKTIEKKIQALFHFTARETEIIRLVFEGYKNVEIANTLFISETTVKNHMRHIFQKANVKNRTSLIHILSTFS
ncbi:LuxR C-terminal-related transcriptional regulator [bacterium]|nr:LuxR C-terminal-related transcriptional regulator [bacterium]